MLKKILKGCLKIALVLAVAAAALWCIPISPGRWGGQEMSAGYTGAFQKNNALDTVAYLHLGGYAKPETVLVRDGWIYATVEGGVLLKMREDGSGLTKVLDTGGCLLGFDFDADGNIIVLDCDYGGTGALLKVAGDGSGKHEVLLSKANGCELFYPNALAISSNGVIYFTDSSTAFPPAKYNSSSSEAAANEALMHTCTGRVFAYDLKTGKVAQLADGFAFSNGVALSADEKSLFICETYAYAVKRLDLETNKVSEFISNIPGFPDNLTKGLDGRYWVGLNGERSDSLDAISDRPLLRKAVWAWEKLSPYIEWLRRPTFKRRKQTSAGEKSESGYCHVFAFTEDGRVTRSLQSGDNGYHRSTGGTETPGRLYIQSINDAGRLAYLEYNKK